MTDWQSFKEDIRTGVLEELGAECIVQVPSESTGRSSTGKKTIESWTSYRGIAVKGKYDSDTTTALNSVIKAGDVKFVCQFDDETFEPVNDKNEKFVFGGKQFNIINVDSVEPSGDVTVIYILQCRRIN